MTNYIKGSPSPPAQPPRTHWCFHREGSYFGLIGLLCELSVALADENVSDVDGILGTRVPVHVHMQDAVDNREHLHQERTAADQGGEAPVGPAAPVLSTDKRLC